MLSEEDLKFQAGLKTLLEESREALDSANYPITDFYLEMMAVQIGFATEGGKDMSTSEFCVLLTNSLSAMENRLNSLERRLDELAQDGA